MYGLLLLLSDVSDCSSLTSITTVEPQPSVQSTAAVIGGVVGGVFLLMIIIILVLFCLSRRRRNAKHNRLQREQLEDMLPEIIKRSRKDENYCQKGQSINLNFWKLSDRLQVSYGKMQENNTAWIFYKKKFLNINSVYTYM